MWPPCDRRVPAGAGRGETAVTTRRVAVGEAHLLNVCIHPDHQGNGFGRQLVKFLIDCARLKNAQRVFLEVRPSNLVAYKLYESIGFNEIGIRENYYPSYLGREDALVLGKELL